MNDSLSRRRVLLLLPYPPRLDARHGGGRVMAQLTAGLAKCNAPGLIYFRGDDEPPISETLNSACEFTHEVKRPWSGAAPRARAIRNGRLVARLLRLSPLWVTDWSSNAFARQARATVETWQPDIVQMEYHVMGQYLSALNHCPAPRVLTEYEPGGSAAPYLKQAPALLNGPLHALDRFAWSRYEPNVLHRVQCVVVFTERDKHALERFKLPTRIVKISPGTDIPKQPLNPTGCAPSSLLFVGSFIHPPNRDAALRLVDKIFPMAQEQYPELQLYIVGSEPPQLQKSQNVIVTGEAPDITPYLDRAALFVAPLRAGGGIRIKVMEALAAGKAVVASPLAAEGLDVQDGRELVLAESDRDFAKRIAELLGDVERRARLAGNARTWATANLSWDSAIDAYQALYESLLAGRGAR